MKNASLSCAFLALLLALGINSALPSAAYAQNNKAAQQAQQTPAGQFIQNIGDQAIKIMADQSLSAEERSDKYREILRSAFDLPTIGRFVLGRAWDGATPQQQQDYQKLFEEMVLKMYGDRLSFYNGEKFQVIGTRPEGGQDTVVLSEILHQGNAPATPVEWRLRQENGKLAAVDVIVDGVSQTITQRQEFASILARNNNNIDALLDMMRARVKGNTAGQASQ